LSCDVKNIPLEKDKKNLIVIRCNRIFSKRERDDLLHTAEMLKEHHDILLIQISDDVELELLSKEEKERIIRLLKQGD
jgi:hypothetical protein